MSDVDQALLMRALGFSADDLAANRRIDLSPAQVAVIKNERDFMNEAADRAERTGWLPVVMLVVLLGIIGGLLYFTGLLDQLRGSLGDLFWPVAAGAGVLIVVLLVYARQSQRENIATFRAMSAPTKVLPAVQVAEGPVQTIEEVRRLHGGAGDIGPGRISGVSYYALVRMPDREHRIMMRKGGMEAFAAGRRYRIYFYEDEGGAKLLSAEPLA